MRSHIDELLAQDEPLPEILEQIARLGAQLLMQAALEASGACTEPVYYALYEQGFTEVAVINPAHAKALKGRRQGRRAAGGAV